MKFADKSTTTVKVQSDNFPISLNPIKFMAINEKIVNQ